MYASKAIGFKYDLICLYDYWTTDSWHLMEFRLCNKYKFIDNSYRAPVVFVVSFTQTRYYIPIVKTLYIDQNHILLLWLVSILEWPNDLPWKKIILQCYFVDIIQCFNFRSIVIKVEFYTSYRMLRTLL